MKNKHLEGGYITQFCSFPSYKNQYQSSIMTPYLGEAVSFFRKEFIKAYNIQEVTKELIKKSSFHYFDIIGYKNCPSFKNEWLTTKISFDNLPKNFGEGFYYKLKYSHKELFQNNPNLLTFCCSNKKDDVEFVAEICNKIAIIR